MRKGDINKLNLNEIIDFCKKYYCTRHGVRGSRRKGGQIDVTQVMEEIENLKHDIFFYT